MFDPEMENDWRQILRNEFEKEYFHQLSEAVIDEYSRYTCYPPVYQVYSAFNYCSFDNVKIVLIGQDPYHGKGQANGMCFSVNDGVPHPPSLRNIFRELESDVSLPIPESGDLSHWAKQGVLLLNATLTVRENKAGSHQRLGWEQFTDEVIRLVSEQKEKVVFMLWGGYAKKKGVKIDNKKHLVLTSGHPSPLSANQGYWFGNRHFSQANNFLEKHGFSPINW